MAILISLLVTAGAVIITAYILPGVRVTGFINAFVVAVVLALINTFIRPAIMYLALPINVLTLGLFTLVINALIIMIVAGIIPGFRVDGFWWALLFSLVLAVINALLFWLIPGV